ncbi:mycofactocin system heme/flavin oxidoreductase MftD [Sorangium cellulosum]|uniref:Mycofactocin system heme/flavin oxidoreductase MftD n=1 Tax=Sorangium cellulosum TaxID=56 RepID=A0A4V0NEI5_SORCE|nr:mycofactocin system heme/flavin oxidoreductase MftD [Sorangium cellulosum]
MPHHPPAARNTADVQEDAVKDPRPAPSLLTVDDFERAARARLSRMAYDYFRSGADEGRTLRENRRAFRRLEIHYRVLVDVAERDMSTTLLGTKVPFPILVAPTAYHRLAHPDGEIASSRAASELGTLFTLSTLSTMSLEAVAEASPGPKWFQLYVHKDRGLTRSLVERAESAGYRALMLTVDTPLLGRRIADVRNGFALPEGLVMANLRDAAAGAPAADRGSLLAAYVAARHDASLTWRDVEWLRSLTRLPVLLKGIVRPDDAVRALDCGAAGVVVSNHGARQLDGAPATISVLPAIADAVAGRALVLMDGGVRWGTDVLKALALGARAVLVGRPVLWGLSALGGEGVARVLAGLRDELSVAMALAGCPTLASIDRDLIRRAHA